MNEKSPAKKALKNLKDKRSLENDLKPENKRLLEAKLLRANVELAEKTLEEFPKTKKRANWGLFIAIGLAILELIKWIIQLSSSQQ